jgi:hypothetical protein
VLHQGAIGEGEHGKAFRSDWQKERRCRLKICEL